jgi:hypothetical protein
LNSGQIYLHKILGILYVEQWEDLFTQNNWKYFLWNTVVRFIYTKYCEILSVEHCWNIYSHKILGLLSVEYCGKIFKLHKILGNSFCRTLREDLFTQNTREYFMLNIVGRFIYTKYWEIPYVAHRGKIYLHKILESTLC